MIIDKSYTIKFSFAGIRQFADFHEKNGELVSPRLSVNWSKTGQIPNISNLKSIDEVLSAIKSFACDNRAEIYLINGNPVFYDKKTETQDILKKMKTVFEDFVEEQVFLFFEKELKPLIKRNRWKIGSSHMGRLVLIKKDKNGEWNNIKNTEKEFEFEFLCAKCLYALNIIDRIKLTNEYGNGSIFESHKLFNIIYEKIKSSKFYVEL